MSKFKPRIVLLVVTEDSQTKSTIKAPNITKLMRTAADDLLHVMSTGKRRTP